MYSSENPPISNTLPPCSVATMSAVLMVDSLWAIMMQVLPALRFVRASCTDASDSLSNALVASYTMQKKGGVSEGGLKKKVLVCVCVV